MGQPAPRVHARVRRDPSPTNSATAQGNPNFFASDVPPKGQIKITNQGSQLYFGENLSGYTLVDANQSEFNYPRGR